MCSPRMPKLVTSGRAPGRKGKGHGKGFGKGLDAELAALGVQPVEINGQQMLMSEAGLILDPETHAPVGVMNPATGEVQEITEERR